MFRPVRPIQYRCRYSVRSVHGRGRQRPDTPSRRSGVTFGYIAQTADRLRSRRGGGSPSSLIGAHTAPGPPRNSLSPRFGIAHKETIAWQQLSVLPNLDLQFALEARQCAIVPPHDERVQMLRKAHPNCDTFLSQFGSAHGLHVNPAVILLDDAALASRRGGEAMVALRNACRFRPCSMKARSNCSIRIATASCFRTRSNSIPDSSPWTTTT
jgi:hypothetical protein